MDTAELARLALLGMLADIRAALWTMVAVNGLLSAVVLTHALLTRRRGK